jgi:hypothetical protein
MHGDPTVRDSGSDRCAVFVIAATGISKLHIDHTDRRPPGMISFHRVRQLKQFLLRDLGVGERAIRSLHPSPQMAR